MYINELLALAGYFNTPKAEKLPEEFAILLDGPFSSVDDIFNIIDDNANLDLKQVNRVTEDDIILFTKNDIRVLNDTENILFDVVHSKVKKYKTSKDFIIIKKVLNNFFNNVFTKKKNNKKYDQPIPTICVGALTYNDINEAFLSYDKTRYYDGQQLNVEEKISIFTNFVKVGYDAYEIYETCLGTKLVKIGKTVYEVDTDLFGRKYLQKV
jgi:ABC-type proline/glycine betaine transport system ATPase subunit